MVCCRRFEHGAGPRQSGGESRVHVLDHDGRFIDEHAYGQRQATERHDVDCLAAEPERDDGGQQAIGIVMTTISELRQSRRKTSTISPVSNAPSSASPTSPVRALTTYRDRSKTRSILTSSGATLRMAGSACRTRRITSSVDASARFVTGMYTVRLPLTCA